MARNVFGWDLPPGVTQRQIDEAYGQEGPCAVCGKSVDCCVCPECPVCESQGDLKCYTHIRAGNPGHGLKLNRAQAVSRQSARIKRLQETIMDEQLFLSHLEFGDEESFEIDDIPDPGR